MGSPLLTTDFVEKLRKDMAVYLAEQPQLTPAFSFEIGWSTKYDALLAQQFSFKTAPDQIIPQVVKTGRALISGRGGAAKTSIVHRLIGESLTDSGVFPVLINMKAWNPILEDEWKEFPDWFGRMDFLFRHLGIPEVTVATLDAVDPAVLRLVFLDGLNEVSSTIAQDIITAADEFVRHSLQTATVLTDRIVRRPFREDERWKLGMVLPLSTEEVTKQVNERFGNDVTLNSSQLLFLSTPLFLDQFLKSGEVDSELLTTTAELRMYFKNRVGLSDPQLEKLGRAAFMMYSEEDARSFPLKRFRALVRAPVVRKLSESGALVIAGKFAYFHHHLKHDYLASIYVAKHSKVWTGEVFDAITFLANSFDILALVLEQLPDAESADNFVRRMYDWNVYAPGYALAEASHFESFGVSSEMQTVIFAMLAERKWDIITATSERAKDALRVFPLNLPAHQYLTEVSLAKVFGLVGQVESNMEWFGKWKRLFTLGDRETISDTDLAFILDPDSVLGWTLANVLKRVRVLDRQFQSLRKWTRTRNKTVLWRIAHVLGRYPGKENFDVLIRLFDAKAWVRYGALRSLMEMAAVTTDSKFRGQIFTAVETRASDLLQDERSLEEFRRAVFIRPDRAPVDLASRVIVVITALYKMAETEQQAVSWQKLAARVRQEYVQSKAS